MPATTTITARAHVILSVDVDMRRHPSDIHTFTPPTNPLHLTPLHHHLGAHFPPTVTQLHREQHRLSPSVKHIEIGTSLAHSLARSASAALLLCSAIVGERARCLLSLYK